MFSVVQANLQSYSIFQKFRLSSLINIEDVYVSEYTKEIRFYRHRINKRKWFRSFALWIQHHLINFSLMGDIQIVAEHPFYVFIVLYDIKLMV